MDHQQLPWPPQPIKHPAAWRNAELFERADWTHSLSSSDVAEIRAAVMACESDDLYQITKARFPLPRLGETLVRIQDALENGSGACRMVGLPVDEWTESQLQKILWGLSHYIGTPVSQSASGERIFSVRDAGFADTDPRSRGPNTRKRLTFHSDRCDVIGFLCVQPAKSGGENYVVSSITLFNEILRQRPDLLKILMQPFYYQRHNVDTGNSSPYTQQPIFSIFEGHFAANLLRVLIDRAYASDELPDMSPQQKEALDFVEELASLPELHVQFRQEAGDILFLNNFVTLHRRAEFVDHAELDQRRHLLRIWLSVPNSRPLHPSFAGNYGNTAAGAIRGGMRAVSDGSRT